MEKFFRKGVDIVPNKAHNGGMGVGGGDMFTTLDDAIHGISVVIDATATVVAVNVGTGWFATVTAYDHVASFLDDGSEYPAIRGTATPAQIAEAIGVAV